MPGLSAVLFVAACFGAFISYVTYDVLCFGDVGGTHMCPDGHPTATMTLQLVVGLVGILPAAVMTYFAFTDRRRAAVLSLIAGLVLWAAWAFLNDAAVHEWGSDMRLLP